ncbi:MAG: L-fuculose-phosphate aldolase [Myxococcota bacterium]|jgi:L-fuculose-phosphate aldolase
MRGKGTTLPGLKREMVHWCTKLADRGWVANHDGNISCRLPGRRLLATPTSFAKGEVGEEDLLTLDRHGKKLQGRWRPFSELSMHLVGYGREDVQAVVHAHPPIATAFSIAGLEVETTIIAEAVISLGDRIPTLPYALPGSESQLESLALCLPYFDAFILGNHGVITVGKDIEQAFLRMELVEHLAKIKRDALALGSVRTLSAHDVQTLMRRRTRGGLGPEARGVAGSPPI